MPFEYAFLIYALKDEQAQGITIDSARVFFKTARRPYIIIDAPGHVEFLKNMISGAARADAALLVIDAKEGVQENSRRHGFMLSMLGIRQIAVLVNKMDLVEYSQATFDAVVSEYREFLARFGVTPSWFIPVSGFHGENLVTSAESLSWYRGPTVLDALDAFESRPSLSEAPFRMPVQGVYKFTGQNDDRRIIAGTIDSGRINVGDDVVFYPSGKRSRVKSIERFNGAQPVTLEAEQAAGFTLTEQIFVSRGELAAVAGERAPEVATRLQVSVFWLGKTPFSMGREYGLKLGTTRVPCRIEAVHRVIDASDLSSSEGRREVLRHQVAECTLSVARPVAFDTAVDTPATSRFVIVDEYEIAGGGIIRAALQDEQAWVRDKVLIRNYKWESGAVEPGRRAERYSQRPTLLLISGSADTDRKRLARELEVQLFGEGRHVYHIGMRNLLYGVDADIDKGIENRAEHLRRLGEVTNLLLDTGLIVIATAADLSHDEIEIVRTTSGVERMYTAWIGPAEDPALPVDLLLTEEEAATAGPARLKTLLQDVGAIFRAW